MSSLPSAVLFFGVAKLSFALSVASLSSLVHLTHPFSQLGEEECGCELQSISASLPLSLSPSAAAAYDVSIGAIIPSLPPPSLFPLEISQD